MVNGAALDVGIGGERALPAPSPHTGAARSRRACRSCLSMVMTSVAAPGGRRGAGRPGGRSGSPRGRPRARSRPAPAARPAAAGCASSHSFSIGRSSSRTRSSIVGPPPMDLRPSRCGQRAHQRADRGRGRGGGLGRDQAGPRAAALTACGVGSGVRRSGRLGGRSWVSRFGSDRGVGGSALRPSWRDRGRGHRLLVRWLRLFRRLPSGRLLGARVAGGGSSSLRMRRIGGEDVLHRRIAAARRRAGWSAQSWLAFMLRSTCSAARLVGGVVAGPEPLVPHGIVVGRLVVERHRQVEVARRQPPDGRRPRCRTP